MSDQLTDILHTAICQAVSILNTAPEVARFAEGRQVSRILRQALAAYADAFMEQPAPEHERAAIHKKHRGASTAPTGEAK